MKHYKFTGEIKSHNGIILKQIQATRYLSSEPEVMEGDIGGWIEKENNLSDNAWASENAKVYGDARVYKNARILDNAQIFGSAWVRDNVQVSEDAKIYEHAEITGDAEIYGKAQVYGEAQVYGRAKVSGHAWIFGKARIYGDAGASGHAWIYEKARVFGSAWVREYAHVLGKTYVFGDADISEDIEIKHDLEFLWITLPSFHTATITKKYVFIGCKTFTIKEIQSMTEEEAIKHELPENFANEYKAMILNGIEIIESVFLFKGDNNGHKI